MALGGGSRGPFSRPPARPGKSDSHCPHGSTDPRLKSHSGKQCLLRELHSASAAAYPLLGRCFSLLYTPQDREGQVD